MPFSIRALVAGAVFSSIFGSMPSFAATMDLEKGVKGSPSCRIQANHHFKGNASRLSVSMLNAEAPQSHRTERSPLSR